jgi:drug/metabolite transporter (DMT)-like permease
MLFTTLCYALTDIFLVRLFRAGFGTLEVMVYLFVVSALLLVPFAVRTLKGRYRVNRRFAGGLLMYGSVQLLGGVFLMLSFALAKVATMVNIVQSARGLFAVGVVWLITRAGLEGMEQLSRRQYVMRACGAALMTLSITLAIVANR